MPKQTTNYRLGYFVDGEITGQVTEDRRMRTIDAQLRGLYEVLGNGVIQGWEVGSSGTGRLAVDISYGNGVISFVAIENTVNTTISPLFPNSTNYIYASKLPDSYWNKSVSFSVSVSEIDSSNLILLSKVVTSSTGITSIDNEVRENIGLVSAIQDVVKNHRHVGGTNNPEPVNLASQVEGVLGQENLPDLDASKVKTGKLDRSVIPIIDHTTGLTNSGELTHSQLDSFVQNLSAFGKTVMGETALVNLLQLTLALKHQWPEIDEYLVNHLAFIPGISPDSLIDFNHTTAQVDTRTYAEGGSHKIYGSLGPGMTIFTKTWNSTAEFEAAEKSGTESDGDSIRIEVGEKNVVLDDFESLGNWETKIEDLSSGTGTIELDAIKKVIGGYSAKVGINTLDNSNMAFTMTKTLTNQDWSSYDGISFYITTEDVAHGELFFYINDAVEGVQNSYTLILGRNEPTINRETLLNGWREIYIDISQYARSAINKMGFFMSTQYGWDAQSPFELNVDQATLTTGNRFITGGEARFVYGNGFPQDFWRARWDAVVPTGTTLTVRSRVSNDLADFETDSSTPAPWSAAYTSEFILPTSSDVLYEYAQLEVLMTSSVDQKSSPTLLRLYLDRRVSADNSSFAYNDQDSWESGIGFNIDSASNPGNIQIASMVDVDNIFFGSDGLVEQADSSLTTIFSDSGSSLPRSTRQILAGESAGFGQVSAVKRGENDTLWVADTDNDRVLQIDKAGNIVFGLWGSFIEDPFDGYGTEETGPGSNVDYENLPSDSTEEKTPIALYSMYNPTTKMLSIVFSENIETVDDSGTTFNPEKLMIKIGAKRIYFGLDTQFSLFGIDPLKYPQWAMSANEFIGQFTFKSHILQATLSQADSVALTSVSSMLTPSIAVSISDELKLVNDSKFLLSFVTPNVLIGSASASNNGVRIRINGGVYVYYRTSAILFQQPNIVEGLNVIEAVIVDGNNNPFENTEASCTYSFILDPDDDRSNDPRVSISSPRQGQTLSSSPVEIEFESHNHPVLPVGSCIEYSLDNGSWYEHRNTNPISLSGLAGGTHAIALRLVDSLGDEIDSEWSSATVTFNYGVSANTSISLLVGSGAIRGTTRTDTTKTPETVVPVYVENVYMANLFCPIDIQVIPDETSLVNPSGSPTILVAKLRSQSTTGYLSATSSNTSVPSDANTIFASNYMDGHSVVQYSTSGEVLFSNNAARFADTKTNAKSYLGSANKFSSSDLGIADPIRNRAIIVRTDLSTGKPKIIWEYLSDRLVSDFQLASNDEKTISVSKTASDPEDIYIKTGDIIIWKNDTSRPITIVSGTTTKALFAEDPDLTLYGDEFISQELQPGEQYSKHFDEGGSFDWFSYPDVVTGSVHVDSAGVSQSDEYLMVEKDIIPSVGGGRVIKVNSWGNITWTFGSGMLYDPKDVRRLSNNSIIIST
jgi:plastocyanin